MVETALRGAVREAIKRASEFGLPGNHHFYITFRTDQEGIDIPEYLHERYPEEMTIVLQHQYWGLEPGDDAFQVTLSFNKVPERLVVPYAAITARSEEHTSELQSLMRISYAVFCLKKRQHNTLQI